MRELSRSKQLVINMSANVVSFGVSLFISFFLSPYIVRNLGVEANGFIGLANNFVSYASLITLALNSLAGRFITISLTQKDNEKANIYFTSVYYANWFLAVVVGIVGFFVIAFLDKLVNVPDYLLDDVRLLFICLFVNCFVSIVGSVFTVAPFAKNRLYLESLRNIESSLARALIIVGAFTLFGTKVWYVGLASLISGVYVLLCNIYYTKKLLPEIHVTRSYYSKEAVRELSFSGVWNTIVRLGNILLDGLDLLISNLLIDAAAMGVLSISKTVPNLISSFMGSIVGIFSPDYTILYANGDQNQLLRSIKGSMKIMGIVINAPIVVMIVCGKEFFALWQPTQDAEVLQRLFIITIGCLIFSGGINCIYGIFTVVNKLKANAMAVLIGGASSTAITLILVKTTNLGIYAVAGVSTIVSIIRNLVFTAPYGARCLNLKWYAFYPEIIRPVIFTIIASVIGFGIGNWITADNWIIWFAKAILIGIIALAIGLFIILNKSERKIIYSKLKSRRIRK